MRFPWISREHHAEVLQAKDDYITSLVIQIASLKEQLQRPVAVTVKLPDDFAVIQPAVVRPAKRQAPVDQSQEAIAETPDWENVDENDLRAIAKIAAQELGGPVSPFVLDLKVKSIRKHIRESKLAKARAMSQSGTVTEAAGYVPEHIKKLIDSAEKV